ncbi:hypothetical protein QX216_13285 [Vibrio parahaemolyticus]|nr:hypothetical protein [Vibrio parahaemolyticus]MDS1943073.1 hypothetical protein [Vibrio parahaemolyticus]
MRKLWYCVLHTLIGR